MRERNDISKSKIHKAVDASSIHGDTRLASSGLAELAGKVFIWLTRDYRQWFKNRNYVFEHRGPIRPVMNTPCEVVKYECFDDIHKIVKETIQLYGGERMLEIDRLEMDQDANMWVMFIDGQPVTMKFTRRGRYFKRWFVPLQDDDIVVFRGRTFPEYRGRGLHPALTRFMFQRILHEGQRAFTDCKIHNKSSIRAIQKNNWVRIATMKPISRKQAIG